MLGAWRLLELQALSPLRATKSPLLALQQGRLRYRSGLCLNLGLGLLHLLYSALHAIVRRTVEIMSGFAARLQPGVAQPGRTRTLVPAGVRSSLQLPRLELEAMEATVEQIYPNGGDLGSHTINKRRPADERAIAPATHTHTTKTGHSQLLRYAEFASKVFDISRSVFLVHLGTAFRLCS